MNSQGISLTNALGNQWRIRRSGGSGREEWGCPSLLLGTLEATVRQDSNGLATTAAASFKFLLAMLRGLSYNASAIM